MSVVIETTLGDITVDLYLNERPRACLNFLKLCKIKYYNYNLFHTISRGFIAQTGDPTGTRNGGESIFGVIDGVEKRYFEAETEPRIKHTRHGLISFVGSDNLIGSQFFLTLGEDLTYLDENHCVFGEVAEGSDILEAINEVICDKDDRPYQDVRITHTVILNDPMADPERIRVPSRSPSPSKDRLKGGRIAPDEDIDETSGKTVQEIAEMQAEREAKARATILEMVGDIPDAEMAPPENVLFVCKLNPVTTDDDLEIIFSRFGKINSCEVIRDKKTGDSLQYAFIEFDEQKSCEDAYFKMANVLIDDRRIHVDFSQSVSKVKWLGKGRGVALFDDKGRSTRGRGIGEGDYKVKYEADSRREDNGFRRNDNSRRDVRHIRSPQRRDRKQSPSRDRRSPRRNRRQSRSPRRERRISRSPRRETRNFRSPKRRPRSPIKDRRQSKSPKRKTSRSPRRDRRSSRSPTRSRKHSRSPRREKNGSNRPYESRRPEQGPSGLDKTKRSYSPPQSKTSTTKTENIKSVKMNKIESTQKSKHIEISSSSSEESSSEEEKRRKRKKSKKKKYSSSSDSTSDDLKKKKKKRKKSSSESN